MWTSTVILNDVLLLDTSKASLFLLNLLLDFYLTFTPGIFYLVQY